MSATGELLLRLYTRALARLKSATGELENRITPFGIAEAIAMKPSHSRFTKPWLLIAAAILASPHYASGQHESGDALSYYKRGIERRRQHEYDQAIAFFDEAIRLDPTFAEAYLGRGSSWNSKKEYEKAIDDFNEAIRLDPDQAYPFNGRGIAWHDKKEYDKAIVD